MQASVHINMRLSSFSFVNLLILVVLTFTKECRHSLHYDYSYYYSNCSLTGLGAATFIDLPTGDVVANFEGAINATTLTCNVTNTNGQQVSTIWNVANFDGVPNIRRVSTADPDSNIFLISGDLRPGLTITFGNRITVLNWTSAVDAVTLYCGTGEIPHQAGIALRIYSKYVSFMTYTVQDCHRNP